MTLPDAERLIAALCEQMRPSLAPDTALVGIHTGGAWLAERLHAELGLVTPLGSIDVAFYRDDYDRIGLHRDPLPAHVPFDVAGRNVVLVDDVLYTGRTIRAALNELWDYGRPACVELAVLVDRGGRQLPICARYCAHSMALGAEENLQLERDAQGRFALRLTRRGNA